MASNENDNRRFWRWLAVWCVIVVAFFYGRSLALPFFFDDLDHMPYTARTGLAEIWLSSGPFPYYRPLVAAVWRFFYLLLGFHSPLLLHGLNLLLHGLNGWLTGRLAGRFLHTKTGVWTATTVFLLFPFSYQAVPWVGALYHLLVTTLVQSAVLSALAYRLDGRRRWLVIGLFTTFLAPFAHENGIIVPVLVAILVALQPAPEDRIRPVKNRLMAMLRTFPFWIVPTTIWFAIWLAVPKGRSDPFSTINPEAIGQNSVYFFQGLGFPLAITGGWWRDVWGWNDLWTAAGLSLIIVLAGVWIAYPGRSTRAASAAGLLWFAVSAAPAVLVLSFSYVISAPRLLMLPAVGAALFWGAALEGVQHDRPSAFDEEESRFPLLGLIQRRRLLTITLILLLLLPAASFVNERMLHHAMLGEAWNEAAAATAAANRAGRAAVFINLPSAMTRPHTVFPLGHEATVFMAPYIPIERIMQVQTDGDAAAFFRRHDDIRPEMSYFYDAMGDGRDWPALLAGIDGDAEVWVTRYDPRAIDLERAGGRGRTLALSAWTPPAVFENTGIRLMAGQASLPAAETLAVALRWQIEQPPPYELTVFVHALSDDGRLLAQADGQPWGNTYPMARWPAGALIDDRRVLAVSEIPFGERPAAVLVGIYNRQTGERLMVRLPDGSQADHMTLPLAR